MIIALLSLFTGTAQAETVTAEVLAQATPGGQVAPGVALRLDADNLFLSGEARGYAGDLWVGRATVGIDLLGSDRFDLTLGGFMGSTGTWMGPFFQAEGMTATGGFELGLGVNVGSARLRYRHADGFRGPLTEHLTENELRLGVGLLGTAEVFGQVVRFNPGDDHPLNGGGIGVGLIF